MSHHKIAIELQNGHAIPALSSADVMYVGDTVEYFSPAGKVRVVFDGPKGSPFGNTVPDVVFDSQSRTLQKDGKFFCKCFIEVGWSPGETPESGGDHDVKPSTP